MLPTRNGSIRIFRFAGIDVYLHWLWFLAAIYEVSYGSARYSSLVWCVFEYLAVFSIVLMHEFGHALACRSVGGRADQIVLWLLGGVAYVDPPPRPGAVLWSIAAGPLVNVALVPILTGAVFLTTHAENLGASAHNLAEFISSLWYINVFLLGFNMLPIYPLDGGKIVWALLWFVVGRARSLLIASALGLLTVVLLVVFAFGYFQNNPWLILIVVFAGMQCWSGLQQARVLSRIAAAPPHAGLACPNCKKPPPSGDFWLCGHCKQPFDMFATRGVCPSCGMIFNRARCLECGKGYALDEFREPSQPPS
jgi:Zn-dependent protease